MMLQNKIEDILESIQHPGTGKGLVSSNIIKGLHVDDKGSVAFVMEFDNSDAKIGSDLKEEAQNKIKKIDGVSDVQIVITTEKKPAQKKMEINRQKIPGINKIILVGSGKGGVGKSTTALNLAASLAKLGARVGIVDADVYGPSLPRLLGINQRPKSYDGKNMEPIENHGIKAISMGFMMADNLAAIWRGPMVQGAVLQMMRQVNWGDLDYLIVDLPPGTGDIPLTLAQNFIIDGAIIVTTPQDLSLIDARKAITMFKRLEVPVLGLIENMSYFLCPHCNERSEIFHHGGGRHDAEKEGVPFLGEIPLHMDIRIAADAGHPLNFSTPSIEQAYQSLAKRV